MAFIPGLLNTLGGIFGNSSKPYDKSREEYEKYINKAEGVQQPYVNAGQQGLTNYQDWLNGQKDPAAFINKQIGQYSESPYAHYLQQQAVNAGNNYGSANGLSGSSALALQMQQNAGNIASQDMNQWLQHVLGINTQYGQGQNNLVNYGQNAANSLTNLYGQSAKDQAEQAYNSQAGKQNDFWNTIGGIGEMFGFF